MFVVYLSVNLSISLSLYLSLSIYLSVCLSNLSVHSFSCSFLALVPSMVKNVSQPMLRSDSEWDEFYRTVLSKLPTCFRITGSRQSALAFRDRMERGFIDRMDTVSLRTRTIPPPHPLPWYAIVWCRGFIAILSFLTRSATCLRILALRLYLFLSDARSLSLSLSLSLSYFCACAYLLYLFPSTFFFLSSLFCFFIEVWT